VGVRRRERGRDWDSTIFFEGTSLTTPRPYFLKATPSPNSTTLGAKSSTHSLWDGREVQNPSYNKW
jgi:hypothetical protein